MTVGQWLVQAEQRLRAAGDMDARLDAEWLMSDALRTTRPYLRFRLGDSLAEGTLANLEKWLSRRESGEPLQYVEGFACFMGLDFRVDPRVLIPRQDTEILCEWALKRLGGKASPAVLDLCTGSGALAVSIAYFRPDARVTATDIDENALDVARFNARRLSARVSFRQGDLLAATAGQRFDMIVCNPPYISGADMEKLSREVLHEPRHALFGGADGLDFYRRIADGLNEALLPGGEVLFEVGLGQAAAVSRLLEAALPRGTGGVICDLNGIERVVWRASIE